jgi:hypothetical protein
MVWWSHDKPNQFRADDMVMQNSLNLTKGSLAVVSCLALLGSGCRSLDSSSYAVSLDNASSRTWTVTVSFTSGPPQTYEQAPDTLHDFSTSREEAQPAVTRIVATSKAPPASYSLSARDLANLRRSSPGALMLVLYDGGIACLSPGIKKSMERALAADPDNPREYFHQLRVQEEVSLMWTREALARKP